MGFNMIDIFSVGFIIFLAVFFLVRRALKMSDSSCGSGCNGCSKNTCSTKDFSHVAVTKSQQIIKFQKH